MDFDTHFLSRNLTQAVAAHAAMVPSARSPHVMKSLLDGSYDGPLAGSYSSILRHVAHAQMLPPRLRWQIIGLRDALDVASDPLGFGDKAPTEPAKQLCLPLQDPLR